MNKPFLCLIILVLFQSCITSKSTIYMQSKNYPNKIETVFPFEPTIKSDNILNIVVSGENPEAAAVFNLTSVSRNINSETSNAQSGNLTYLVDNEGYIEMPVLGKIHVAGLKKSELETLLKQKVGKYLSNPLIVIRILNYRLYVLGEVIRPGEQTLNNGERVTILEALSRAGDLSINGNRKKIKILREKNGITTINNIDITKPNFINSDFYYLQQNDVVYVQPDRTRISMASVTPIATAISIVSGGLSLYIILTRL